MTTADLDIDTDLERLASLSGEPYRRERERWLATAPPPAIVALRAAAAPPIGSADSGRTQWIARALVAWHDSPQVCAQVTRYVHGEIDHRGVCHDALGAWDARVRANDAIALGAAALPRVVEMLWCTRDFRDDDGQQLSALMLVLQTAEPSETEALLVEALRSDASLSIRMAAAQWLGESPTESRDAELLDVLVAPANPWALRAECLGALHDRRDLDASLLNIVQHPDEPSGLKAAAISALAQRDPTTAASVASTALRSESGLELSSRYVDIVARHGQPQDTAVLQAVADHHPSPIVRTKAAQAHAAARGG